MARAKKSPAAAPAPVIVALAARGTGPEQVHVFADSELTAIDAALTACRPLLVRGEPGVGKSQLARAAAKHLGRAYLQHVVNARTEPTDLLWHFDAVARLAKAQLWGALRPGGCADDTAETWDKLMDALAVARFLEPRPLWWAFDWPDAAAQAEAVGVPAPPQPDQGDPSKGCVLLIDEIDKAESDVPNGLLEALGNGAFTPQGRTKPVEMQGEPPLVIITSNEERALPDAFLRRCLVLELKLPDTTQGDDALVEHLVLRAQAHFGDAKRYSIADGLLQDAAKLLATDRRRAREQRRFPLPGQAEYLDLVRAVLRGAPHDPAEQKRRLTAVRPYILDKHGGL